MKKKVIIVVVIIVLMILLVPIPFKLRDGGTVEWKSLTYSIANVHSIYAVGAEQVQSKSNNIDNIPEIGKLIIKEGMKNNGLYVQLNAG